MTNGTHTNPTPRAPLPPPWSAELNPNCFIVRDADGQQIAYVYFESEPGRRFAVLIGKASHQIEFALLERTHFSTRDASSNLVEPLSHLNLIFFLFLTHQCESTARPARPRRNKFFYGDNTRAASNRRHCSLRLCNQYPRPSATWSCRRLSSHSIGIERWRP